MLVLDPGEARRNVQVGVGRGGDGVAAHPADVAEAREVVHVGDAEIEGIEGAGVDAQALGVDVVADADDLGEGVVADPGLQDLVGGEGRGPGAAHQPDPGIRDRVEHVLRVRRGGGDGVPVDGLVAAPVHAAQAQLVRVVQPVVELQ